MLKKSLFAGFLNILLLVSLVGKSQDYYWVAFTDKNNSQFSLSNPEEYLSEGALKRRAKQNIAIDSFDLPVNAPYIQQVLNLGAEYVHSSKWLNGVTVNAETDSFRVLALQLPFVKQVQLTKPAGEQKSAVDKFRELELPDDSLSIDTSFYGLSVYQVAQLNGQYLHKQNYRGQNMQIAVLDGGFYEVNNYPAFDSLRTENRILGAKDFVNPKVDFYRTHYHGMSVLSCMAGNVPGKLVGTAPDASYWLIRSEDTSSEYLIEEDNWVAAAEFADSVGADIINSSLGYFEFDDEQMNHTYAEMDGRTTRAAIGANIAASRGMLVFCSAGNEGNDEWKYIITPSDADGAIAVGAVDYLAEPASFTSFGPAADGDVKPNVAALGRSTYLQKIDGSFGYSNGTSFSAPVMAGMGACLWQANPAASALQVKHAIEQSASLYPASDSLTGYGIPDMKIADKILKSFWDTLKEEKNVWLVYPNPAVDHIYVQRSDPNENELVKLSFFTIDGRLILNQQKTPTSKIVISNLQALPAGLLILKIESETTTETVKISLIR